MVLVKALCIGFLISLPTGPVGFLCVRRTLISGPRAGMRSALGAILSDIFYVSIVSFGLSHISTYLLIYQVPLRVAAAALLLYMGIRGLKKKVPEEALTIGEYNPFGEFLSTFFLNITNPILILTFGFLFSSFGIQVRSEGYHDLLVFIGGIIFGSLVFWFLFTKLISHIHERYFPLELKRINYITAVVILVTGVFVFISIFV